MRKVPKELQTRLDSGATTLCRCWKIIRQDGFVLGFTDHDGAVEFDGATFRADSGMDASALQTSTGLNVDNAQAVGALTHSSITDADIRAGKYDRAEVFHWLVDWERPDLRILLFRGSLGEIRRTDGAFEVELRGLAEALNVPVGRTVLRTCDRVLGDGKCGFDLNKPGFWGEADATAASQGSRIQSTGLAAFEDGWFRNGVLTWLTGRNAGDRLIIKSDRLQDDLRTLELWRQPNFDVEPGDRFRVVAGCDKQSGTCLKKFGNLLNFRGFPQLPNEDWVAAYPKDGSVHDGSSLRR